MDSRKGLQGKRRDAKWRGEDEEKPGMMGMGRFGVIEKM